MALIIIFAGIVVCVYGSHFFSSSEMVFSSASEVRLQHEADKNDSNARKALYIIEHFDDALSTILIGNNLVNIAASSLTSVFVILATGDDALTPLGTAIVTIAIIIFGETIAKISAKKHPNTLALRYASPIRLLMLLFYPLVYIVVVLTKAITMFIKESEEDSDEEQVEALQSIIETAEDEGVLSKGRTELLQAAIEFSEKSAVEVMTSRVDMDAIDIDDPKEEILEFINKTQYSRIPVYKDSIDNVIGVLHITHVLKALTDEESDTDIRKLLMPPYFVYKTMALPEVLNQLKKAKQHLAIVTDEYGGTLGVITMEDVLEEIVGEIWDETDKIEEDYVENNQHEFEIAGDMSIRDFLELMEMEEFEDEFESETVGGLVIEIVGHYPKKHQKIDYYALHIEVLEVSDRRVEKVLVKKMSEYIENKA